MTDKNLILHIGTHKTGTTTIQNTLFAERESLLANGYLFGATDRNPYPRLAKHTSTFSAINGSRMEQEVEAENIIREFEESGCHTLILSEEGFSNLNFDCCGYFRHYFQDFSIRTVVFFRRPDYFLESLWNQFVGHRKDTRSITQFARSNDVLARLNYKKLLERWEKLGDVCVGNFEDASISGLESEFCRLAKVPSLPVQKRSNVSSSMNVAAMMVLLNRMGLNYIEADVSKFLGAEDRTKYALGSRERKKIMSTCESDLLWIEGRYGVAFDAALPEENVFPVSSPVIKTMAFAVLSKLNLLG